MTNDQLADALAGATVEMLREDAAALIPWARAMSSEMSPRFYRFAALALAVARVEADESIGWTMRVTPCPPDLDDNESFILALAALLREAK